LILPHYTSDMHERSAGPGQPGRRAITRRQAHNNYSRKKRIALLCKRHKRIKIIFMKFVSVCTVCRLEKPIRVEVRNAQAGNQSFSPTSTHLLRKGNQFNKRNLWCINFFRNSTIVTNTLTQNFTLTIYGNKVDVLSRISLFFKEFRQEIQFLKSIVLLLIKQ